MDTGNFLAQVHEGMKVFDRQHHEIGKVEFVKMSDDDPSTEAVESAAPPVEPRNDTFLDNLAEAFAPDQLPEAIRDRLMQQGFVRIDAKGMFEADRYITPDQIMSVSGNAMTLNVTKDELIRKH